MSKVIVAPTAPAVCATDGRWVVAGKDRNGLRPLRVARTDDGLLIVGSEAGMCRVEEARIKARRQALESAEERVKQLATALLVAREELGEEPKVKTAHYTAWLAETQSVAGPEDVSEWPETWRRVKTEPDRAAALKAAKAGEELPSGFRLESKRGVRWR